MMETRYEAVYCIVNSGFAEAAMDAARKAGARGGTILAGRGTASRDAETKFNIRIQPEKEMLLILVPAEIKDQVLRALYDSAGLDSAGQGIAFSMPVEKTVGLSMPQKEETKESNEA